MDPLSTAEFKALKITEKNDRLHAVLNRPHVRNAIDQQMVDELHALCDYLEITPKVLILSGTTVETKKGPRGFFASGADISQLRDRRRDDALRGINSTVFNRVANLPMPVIAALDGFALGGGAELAYAADFRIGTSRLRFGQPETGLGIMAAAGATWRLSRLVGESLAKELLLTGRTLTGAECLNHGIITRMVEPESLVEAAHELADAVARQDPLAVRLTKASFHAPQEAHPFIDTVAQAVLFESEEKLSRMDEFLKRSSGNDAQTKGDS